MNKLFLLATVLTLSITGNISEQRKISNLNNPKFVLQTESTDSFKIQNLLYENELMRQPAVNIPTSYVWSDCDKDLYTIKLKANLTYIFAFKTNIDMPQFPNDSDIDGSATQLSGNKTIDLLFTNKALQWHYAIVKSSEDFNINSMTWNNIDPEYTIEKAMVYYGNSLPSDDIYDKFKSDINGPLIDGSSINYTGDIDYIPTDAQLIGMLKAVDETDGDVSDTITIVENPIRIADPILRWTEYPVKFSAHDKSGNYSYFTMNITFNDNIAPTGGDYYSGDEISGGLTIPFFEIGQTSMKDILDSLIEFIPLYLGSIIDNYAKMPDNIAGLKYSSTEFKKYYEDNKLNLKSLAAFGITSEGTDIYYPDSSYEAIADNLIDSLEFTNNTFVQQLSKISKYTADEIVTMISSYSFSDKTSTEQLKKKDLIIKSGSFSFSYQYADADLNNFGENGAINNLNFVTRDTSTPTITGPESITKQNSVSLTKENILSRYTAVDNGTATDKLVWDLIDLDGFFKNQSKVGSYSLQVTCRDSDNNTAVYNIEIENVDNIAPVWYADNYIMVANTIILEKSDIIKYLIQSKTMSSAYTSVELQGLSRYQSENKVGEVYEINASITDQGVVKKAKIYIAPQGVEEQIKAYSFWECLSQTTLDIVEHVINFFAKMFGKTFEKWSTPASWLNK